MTNGTPEEQDNCLCWMEHYMDCHQRPFCVECACQICPQSDPFTNPPPIHTP